MLKVGIRLEEKMIGRGFVLSLLLLVLPVSLAYAHDEHHKGGHNHDHAALCERFISKAEGNFPDLTESHWLKILVFNNTGSSFTYTFYHDSTRPDLKVAAMTVTGIIPGTDSVLTRITWQVNDEMLSVRLELDEMVCVKSVIGTDGRTYDLEGLMKKLTEKETI